MRDTDAEDILKNLSAALEEGGLGWLVREVSAAVQEGRGQETVKVKRPRGRPSLHPPQDEEGEKRRAGEFTRSIPYSPQEQLALLEGAINGVFADSVSLNEVLVNEFERVTFQSEGRFAEEPTFVVDNHAVVTRREAEGRVSELMKRLREESEE